MNTTPTTPDFAQIVATLREKLQRNKQENEYIERILSTIPPHMLVADMKLDTNPGKPVTKIIVGILEKLEGNFTLEALQQMLAARGVNIDKRKIFYKLRSIQGVKTVTPGRGQHPAMYTYEKSEK